MGPFMDDAAKAVEDLWDRVVALAERIGPAEWSRPTPCPDLDVKGVVAHVATTPGPGVRAGATPERLVAELRAARAREAARVAALTGADTTGRGDGASTERVLGAACLDLWVHAHDLSVALGEPVDLDEDSPAVAEACRYLLRFTPQLFAARSGADDGAALQIALRGPVDHDAALEVRDARGRWRNGAAGAAHAVSATPAAFILLLSGRGEPEQWRGLGALEWSGDGGEAFVHSARLFV